MRLVLLSLLLLPSLAHAAPVFAAIGTFFGASAATAVAVGLAVVQIGLTVAMRVYGAAKQRREARRRRDAYNAALQDRTVTRVATESPYVYVYGRARVGSSIVAMLSSGTNDRYKHLVCIHAAHECDGFEEIYINGKPLGTLDADGAPISSEFNKTVSGWAKETHTGGTFALSHTPSGEMWIVPSSWNEEAQGTTPNISFSLVGSTVTTDAAWNGVSIKVHYQYSDNLSSVRVKKHLGTPSEAADASLIAEVPSKWAPNYVLRGFCYVVVRLDLTEPEFQGGPPTVEALLRGKKLYDVRTGSTAWSQNPALIVYDYLTSEMCGVDATDIPLASVIAAANVCDEAVSGIGARYIINGTVNSDESQSGVLEKMAQAMAGGIVSTTWNMWAGKYVAPVMALEQSDIVGKIAITPGISDADLYNGVRGQFVDSQNAYVATDFKPYQNNAYVTADGKEKWTNIDYPFTDTLQRVHNLSRIATEDQRNGYTVIADFSLKAWKLKIGDRVTLTSPFFGWNEKVFRVTDKKFSPSSPVQLSLKEDAAEIWDEADAVTVDATPNTNLPNPFIVAPLESLSCESGTDALLVAQDGTIISRILATWPAASFADGQIEIQWQRIGSDVWERTFARADDTQAYLSPVRDGSVYVVRARCIKTYMAAKSDWVFAPLHTVIGKTEPPPNYDTFTVSFQPDGTRQFEFAYTTTSAPVDLAGPAIRYKQGSEVEPDWNTMTPLNSETFPFPSSPYETNLLLAGDHVFALRAKDTTGNLAETPLYIYATLPDRRLGNVLEEFYEHVEGWTGTLTDCHITDSGGIEADNGGTWTTHATWADMGRWNSNPASPIIYETPARDLGAVITGGINSTIDAEGSASIEMRTSADGVSWSAWGSAGGLFAARHVQVRATITATVDDPIARINTWIVQIQADVISETINDANISTYTGSNRIGTGDIRIPLASTYSVIKRVSVAIQDSTATAWSWAIIDKTTTGPRIQFRANGVLTDPALVDFYIEGS
jgi:hypothetical protein